MPTDFLEEYAKPYPAQLVLAHLVESDEKYASFYKEYKGLKI